MGAAHSYLEFPRRRDRIPCDPQNPSTAGLISDGQVPHAPTGSAGDDVRRRHAPSSNVLGIAGQNHVIWFHRPFRCDDWLLHVIESPTGQAARGLVRGAVFTRDGRLVASTAQEGLIRSRV